MSVIFTIYHGGKFIRDFDLRYINYEVDEVEYDPDNICYLYMVKLIQSRNYLNVGRILFKAPDEDLINGLRVLEDDTSSIDLIVVCLKSGGCEIYVDHRVDEPVFSDVTHLLTGSEPNTSWAKVVKPNNRIGGADVDY